MIIPDWKTIRPIPAKKYSQLDSGATKYNNDCGAGVGMAVLSAYKRTSMTVTEFYEKALAKMGYPPGTDAYLSISAIQSVLRDEGVNTISASYATMANLFDYLYQGRPVGILVNNYGILVDAGLTELTKFRGSHFVTLVGVLLGREQYFAIYDPYTHGDQISYWDTKNFYDAWSYGQAGNAPRCLFVPDRKWVIDNFSDAPVDPEPPPSGMMVYECIVSALTVRDKPDSSGKAVRYIHLGDRVDVTEIMSNGWLHLSGGYYCSGSTTYMRRVS